MHTVAPLARLVDQLRRLPGVGAKSATRLAYHVLNMTEDQMKSLVGAMTEARERIGYCSTCFALTDSDPCEICRDEHRQGQLICVVEDVKDVTAMEKIRDFKGKYHVLHGRLSPMEGIGPDELKVKELLQRLANQEIEEVILATNPNVEGEATAIYLARLIKPMGIKVTRIAHGIPVGGDLEYADEVTLAKAMENRREI